MAFPFAVISLLIGAVIGAREGVRDAEDRAIRQGAEEVRRLVQKELDAHTRSMKHYMRGNVRDVLVTAVFCVLMWSLPYWGLPYVFFLCAFLYTIRSLLKRLPLLLRSLPMVGDFIWRSMRNGSISGAVREIVRERVSIEVQWKISDRIENLDFMSSALHGVFGSTRSEIENAINTESDGEIYVETVKFTSSLINYGVAFMLVSLGGIFARYIMWSSEYNWLADLWVWIRSI